MKKRIGRPADPSKLATLTCPVCSSSFTRFKSKIKKNSVPTCSKECGDVARRATMQQHGADPAWRRKTLEGTIKGLRRAKRRARCTCDNRGEMTPCPVPGHSA